MGGAPPTGEDGVLAPLVDVGTGERRRLDRLDVRGRIALLDWRSSSISPSDIGLELGLRGAVGIVLNCPEGGPFYQSPRALGSFSSHWHAGAPPFVTMCKEDAAELRAAHRAAPLEVRLTLRADLQPGVPGYNVVGYLPGRRRGAPIVVGAHHDGWFSAAFDNASGVAAMLALARALAAIGAAARAFDLLHLAHGRGVRPHRQRLQLVHRRLGTDQRHAPRLGRRLALPPQPRGQRPSRAPAAARGAGRARGLGTPAGAHGRRRGLAHERLARELGAPVTGTELWPFLISGVPGVSAYTWERSFMRTDYHTQFDTIETVDFAHLERLCRFYAFLLLSADADPGGILDHRARARDLAKAAAALGDPGRALAAAAEAHGRRRGRRAFTAVGRGLCAIDAHGATTYPHIQAARDVAHLEAALAALAAGEQGSAIRKLARVGDNALARVLSEEAFRIQRERGRREHPRASWGARSHPTASPNLWRELASLRGERGSRSPGPWLEASLARHLARSRAELARRLAGMAAGAELELLDVPGARGAGIARARLDRPGRARCRGPSCPRARARRGSARSASRT